ncbi:hypothetical protein B0H14DRAFT_3166893 [Mycena olivaceomarginata]|nr:hypothetical protein B0H14DRAFT_3166893 [Mycena olivaceomarginata]
MVCIPSDPDISGIGVRAAIYIQNLLSFAPAIWALWDGRVTEYELESVEKQSTTILLTAFAVLISAMVEARTVGLSNFHAIGGSGSEDPVNRTDDPEKLEDPKSQPQSDIQEVNDTVDDLTGLFGRIVLLLGSVHLSMMAALGMWLWSNPSLFGTANSCAIHSASTVILGHNIPLGSMGLRVASLAIYTLFLAPGPNLILPMCLFLGLFIGYQRPRLPRASYDSSPADSDSSQRTQSQRTRTRPEALPTNVMAKAMLLCQTWYDALPHYPSIVPIVIGVGILFTINLIFLIDIERTLRHNRFLQDSSEATWSFGQILAMLLLVMPLRDLWETIRARHEKRHMVDQVRIDNLIAKLQAKDFDVAQLDKIEKAVYRDRIKEVVKKIAEPHNGPQTSGLPRRDMPPLRRMLYGRKAVIQKVVSLLTSERRSRICITAAGGMGKTSVALAVMENVTVNSVFLKEHQFWIPCIEATSPDILRRILYNQLRITAASYNSLDELVAELNASPERRRVLVLDNFETPWLTGDPSYRTEVHDMLCQLAKLPHVALLATMTSSFPPMDNIEWENIQLPPLDPAAALQTFNGIYPNTADATKLNELLHALGHIPLAISLMAADGRRSQASPDDLLREWKQSDTEILSRVDQMISLLMHRDVIASNPQVLTLFATLCMLPAGTTDENLRRWAPTLTTGYTAYEILRSAALIEQTDGNPATSRIFVHPAVQAYMSSRDRISDEMKHQVQDACYMFVLAHKSTPDDARYKADVQALAREETNIQGLLMQIDPHNLRPNALDALIVFSLYQSRTRANVVVAVHALEVARATQNNRHIAEAHHCLGKILLVLDRYEEANRHLEDAHRCFKDLPGGADRVRAAECSMDLAQVFMYTGTVPLSKIRGLVLEAQADLSHDANERHHVARGLLGLGSFLWYSARVDEALETLSTAKAMFDELECPAATAECLSLIARGYASKHEYAKAFAIAMQALMRAEQAGNGSLLATVLRTTARCLIALASYDEAFAIIERALLQSQALGSPLGLAQSLELLGYTYAAKMDVPGSQSAYNGARAQYAHVGINTTFLGADGQRRCSDNLKKLGGMTNLDQSGFSILVKPMPLY